MKLRSNKILISFSLICSLLYYTPTFTSFDSVLSDSSKLALIGVGLAGGTFATWKTSCYMYYNYKAGQVSLENLINQFTHDSEIINTILKDHYKFTATQSINPYIIKHYGQYPYPAHEYFKVLKNLLKKLAYYKRVFEIKKSRVHKNLTLASYIDRYIQAATLLEMKLEILYKAVPLSHEYIIEKQAREWRPVKAACCFATGMVAGAGLLYVWPTIESYFSPAQ